MRKKQPFSGLDPATSNEKHGSGGVRLHLFLSALFQECDNSDDNDHDSKNDFQQGAGKEPDERAERRFPRVRVVRYLLAEVGANEGAYKDSPQSERSEGDDEHPRQQPEGTAPHPFLGAAELLGAQSRNYIVQYCDDHSYNADYHPKRNGKFYGFGERQHNQACQTDGGARYARHYRTNQADEHQHKCYDNQCDFHRVVLIVFLFVRIERRAQIILLLE